ncbi:hypothetical protein [Nonomuraea dietziae]|uniref:hypothetical protein n=1 Tax=Nonomuraea dietziae TaxID=65515 RepID=UPI0031E14AD3
MARSADGERFTTVALLPRHRFGAAMVERPALVRTSSDRWRLYVSCATPAGPSTGGSSPVEAASPEGLAEADVRPVFEGDARTGGQGPGDPVRRPEVAGVDLLATHWTCRARRTA